MPSLVEIVVPKLMPRALWWFRWSAVVTVLAGIGYWMHIVATDARSASVAGEAVSPGRCSAAFLCSGRWRSLLRWAR